MEPGATEYWEGVPLVVPPVPPTGLGGTCSVIEVRYERVTLTYIPHLYGAD